MNHDEIIRWFRRFRYDPEFRPPNGSVPIVCICEFVGISRTYLYQILRKEVRPSRACEAKLTAAIEAVQAGMRWRRQHQVWRLVDERFKKLPSYERSRSAA